MTSRGRRERCEVAARGQQEDEVAASIALTTRGRGELAASTSTFDGERTTTRRQRVRVLLLWRFERDQLWGKIEDLGL